MSANKLRNPPKTKKKKMSNYPIAIQNGIPVYVNDLLCIRKELKQFRFPKSKKRRIRKKWTNNTRNYRVEDVHKLVTLEGKMYVSQKDFDRLTKSIPTTSKR